MLIGESTDAAETYVAMTRGRESNTAHLVADTLEDAKQQWVDVFSRHCADLGPAHARRQAIDAIEVYGAHSSADQCPSTPADGVPLGL